MTAINLAVQSAKRAAYLITDCAFTAPDGTIDKIAGKIISFDRFPCAIGVTGNINLAVLAHALEATDARNLRSLLKGLPGALKRAVDAVKAAHGIEGCGTLRVAAWCSRQKRPVGYLIMSDQLAAEAMIGLGWGAYQVAECKNAQAIHVDASELLGRPVDLSDATTFDPHVDGFRLVEAQRATSQINITPGIDSSACYRIGGEVELTEVTRRGVKVWCIGTFPDKVGERIKP